MDARVKAWLIDFAVTAAGFGLLGHALLDIGVAWVVFAALVFGALMASLAALSGFASMGRRFVGLAPDPED
jgi:hypothetical protein